MTSTGSPVARRSQDKATLFLYLALTTDQSDAGIVTTDQSEDRSVVSEQQPRSVYNQLLNCQSREFYFSTEICDSGLEKKSLWILTGTAWVEGEEVRSLLMYKNRVP